MRTAALVAAFIATPAFAQTDSQLRYVCKQFIERRLHDPSRASLDWTNGRIGQGKGGLKIVQISGRASNAMGAIVLATFQCTIRYAPPDDFRLVELKTF